MKYKRVGLTACLLVNAVIYCSAQQGRMVQDISTLNWKLWKDTAASWQNDRLYTPPVDLRALPVNLPTGGWNALKTAKGITVYLPATVEEYCWGANGNAFGVSGNYLGVSWFATTLNIPAAMKGKHIVLHFESVRFRAEIFVNRKLAGYDLVNSTPFDVDITETAVCGKENEIAVRITDPNGNFDWRDSQNFMWGDYRTQPTHGFGGITGRVTLLATDKIYLDDIFVKNKPDAHTVDIELTARNLLTTSTAGKWLLQVSEAAGRKKVYEQEYPAPQLAAGTSVYRYTISLPTAKLWSVDSPHLYILTARWKGNDGSADSLSQRFGFRWFEVKEKDGDQRFYLNGKRIVLRTAISWGFWPENGIAPSDELARKQVMDAKRLGQNMLNFHRTIGQRNVLDYADELGLLYFEEPGGNSYPENLFNPKNELEKKQTDFYLAARNEKFFRMIKRDRSHPSLVIYNMHNERGALPQQVDRDEMMAGHRLDETRIITYNSSNGNIKLNEPDPKFKLHLFPYDTAFYDYGWFDQHHAGGPGVYHNNLYTNPTQYAKYTDHKDEIIYYGEEGAIGTPPRLQLIRDAILKRGKDIGWESDTYLKWYDAYDVFLKKNNFSKAFPNVDSLTRKIGNVAYYYQGRTIENVRINNTIDGYAVNGWESMKLENHSGIVDNYRNLKGDPDLIARYNKPLYIAVKTANKVLQAGDTARVDFYIVNEKDVKGAYTLALRAVNDDNKTIWSKTAAVTVSGGETYGELLLPDIQIAPVAPGYTRIVAELKSGNAIIASGDDALFAVRPDADSIAADGMVADSSGSIAAWLRSMGVQTKPYKSGRPEGSYLIIGAFEPPVTGNPLVLDLLEWVNNGNTLIVAGTAEKWAGFLAKKEVIDFRGAQVMGTSWYGGNYFVKSHPLFDGLPESCVFNWEYQCFATYNKERIGLRMFNGETVVGCVSDHKQEVYSALSIVPYGRGKIILCSLDILSCLKDVKATKRAEGDGENASMNTFNASGRNGANVVAQKLLLNMLRWASRGK